jgi:hypothetical protein
MNEIALAIDARASPHGNLYALYIADALHRLRAVDHLLLSVQLTPANL